MIDLSTALVRFVWLMTEDVRQMNRPPIEEALGIELDAIRLGTVDPAIGTLLRNLSVLEPDESWRRDLLAATLDWGVLFESGVAQATPTQTAAGLAQDIRDIQSADTGKPILGEPASDDDPAREAVGSITKVVGRGRGGIEIERTGLILGQTQTHPGRRPVQCR